MSIFRDEHYISIGYSSTPSTVESSIAALLIKTVYAHGEWPKTG